MPPYNIASAFTLTIYVQLYNFGSVITLITYMLLYNFGSVITLIVYVLRYNVGVVITLTVYILLYNTCRPRWLSWMRRPTGDQEVAGSTPAEVGNIPSWRLIMKYFLRSFSPFRWFKKGSCQFLAKECAQYWLTA